MKKIGILWHYYEWRPGENCHIERIVCPVCASIESAMVLHTKPHYHKLHVCGNCEKVIGSNRWKPVEDVAEPPGTLARPQSQVEPDGKEGQPYTLF